MIVIRLTLICLVFPFCYPSFITAQSKVIHGADSFVLIENGSGGLNVTLDPGDRFGRDHDAIGDVDGDGVIDLVIGARSDDDGQTDAGAVYILFMNADGTTKAQQKISMLEGGFSETLSPGNFFGYGVAGIGDINQDQIPDIAVSAPVLPNNSIYIIHLNSNGTVKNYVKNTNVPAQGLSAIGDLNNDGKINLVACNPRSNIGGPQRGSISILFLNDSSQIVHDSTVEINSDNGNFGLGLENGDQFGGRAAAMLGDLDGDGSKELAVAAFLSNGGKGAIWILSLDPANHNVISKIKITEGLNGFTDTLTTSQNPNGSFGAQFGHALCAAGDLNGDGIMDLITGANQQNEGWGYVLYLNSNKTVNTFNRINNQDGGFDFSLQPEERFTRSISFIGDLRGDGSTAINIGGGAGGTGSIYITFLKSCSHLNQNGNNFWQGGSTLFSNWDHGSQMIIGDSLTYEQCAWKAFENNAAFITYNPLDGRCICKDSLATLATSSELSLAYVNACYSGFICPINRIISNSISGNSSYSASSSISTTGTVTALGKTAFNAIDSITLNPTFDIPLGSEFIATMNGCD